MLNCYSCGYKTRVYNTFTKNNRVVRYRKCLNPKCKKTFVTIEICKEYIPKLKTIKLQLKLAIAELAKIDNVETKLKG